MRPSSGLTFGGRYQLSSRIAIGGMGEVWQATDLVIGRTVAIKILKDEYLGDPGFLERFRAEARHAALVNHEGIANVFDYGEEDGSAFLVMELVPGEALSAILERERVLTTDRVLDIVAQTASALQAAHAAGLVHRDIKPGNLLITPDGRVKITDFGIARIADQVPLTATGQVMGTVQYLSPEQASGKSASPSTDIYSLGIVAYEALAGRRPFTGESQVAIAMAQINETPPELPITVAEPVRNLVYACIAKKPADRPESAAHLARAAQSLRRGDVAAAATAVPAILGPGSLAAAAGANYGQNDAETRLLPTNSGGAAIPPKKRNPWTWPLIALVCLLAVVLVATIIALVASPGQPGGVSSSPRTSSSPPPPSSPTPTPSATMVFLDPTLILGKSRDVVEARLEDRNLQLKDVDGKPATKSADVGKAYEVSPNGFVPPNSVITVTFYTAIATPPKPQAVTVTEPSPYAAGEHITINWTNYTCPAGHARSGYTFTIDNPSPPDDTTQVDKDATSLTITLSMTQGDTNITYVAQCTDLTSAASDPTTVHTGP
jgi:eukaryotic-like serine/threonine-protein kinase